MSDYLFDGEGPPDLEVARLERDLRPFRYQAPGRSPWRATGWAVALAAAALLVVALWQARGPAPWSVQTASCQGCTWEEGTPLDTSAEAVAQLADRGTLAARAGTQVTLLHRAPHARLALERGTLDVAVDAPARWLVVQLPGVDLVDLGCAYTVAVDQGGHGVVHVRGGWVALEGDSTTHVPAGAAAATWPSGHAGLPVVEGAGAALVAAVDAFDRGSTEAAGAVIAHAGRPQDALTLWHLLQRVEPGGRVPVVQRLRGVTPGALPATDAALLGLDPDALDQTLAYLVGATM